MKLALPSPLLTRKGVSVWLRAYHSWRSPDWLRRERRALAVGRHGAKFGVFTTTELSAILDWKVSPEIFKRAREAVMQNDPQLVEEQCRAAFLQGPTRLAVDHLIGLKGIRIPVASAILHCAWRREYPILDKNVLWTTHAFHLRTTSRPSSKELRALACEYGVWREYFSFFAACRTSLEVSAFALDRAMWFFGRRKGKLPRK